MISASILSRSPGQRRSWDPSTRSGTGSGRLLLRVRHTAGGVSNATTNAGIPAALARSRQADRRSAFIPRVSTTVSSLLAIRWSSTRSRRSKAASPAAWSCSPSPTRLRNRSDDTTWSGRNHSSAHADFPAPDGPARMTSDGTGILRSSMSPNLGREYLTFCQPWVGEYLVGSCQPWVGVTGDVATNPGLGRACRILRRWVAPRSSSVAADRSAPTRWGCSRRSSSTGSPPTWS